MNQGNIHEAKTNLSKRIEQAATGEEIITARAVQPVARITVIQPMKKGHHFGALVGHASVDE